MLAFSSAAWPWSPHILRFAVNKKQVSFNIWACYLIK
jgi:hypothetical protein